MNMRWSFQLVIAVLIIAAALIAMSGPADANDAPAVEQTAAIAELRAEMRQTLASIGAMSNKLEQLGDNWRQFWQRAPVFREQLAASEARARSERDKLEARLVNVEQARWVGAGALLILGWFLWLVRRDLRIRYEPPAPPKAERAE